MRGAGFQEFIEILRNGDAEAVDRLLSDFDPFLRRAIRLRLFDRRTRRVVDTSDIIQSLLKDFLGREEADGAAASSERLRAYLTAAAQYKVSSKTRKERRRIAELGDFAEPVSPEPPPSKQAEDRDFIDAIRSRLDEGGRRLFDWSQQGRTWRDIANEIGGHPDTLRIQLRRSVAAALAEIRHGEPSDAG
jgi:DNA-directed RNA polymerase specialized sigma24 family protein